MISFYVQTIYIRFNPMRNTDAQAPRNKSTPKNKNNFLDEQKIN